MENIALFSILFLCACIVGGAIFLCIALRDLLHNRGTADEARDNLKRAEDACERAEERTRELEGTITEAEGIIEDIRSQRVES